MMNFQQYRPGGLGGFMPVVLNLLILNGLFFLATFSLGGARGIDLYALLGLRYPGADAFAPYQFITYMFMHGGLMHLFFNMFALWMFGNVLEQVWGGRRFLIYYFFTGIGAALIHYGVMYFEIHPVIKALNGFLANPGIESLDAILSIHKFRVSPTSGEIWIGFQEFSRAIDVLQTSPNNIDALQTSVDFIVEYKKHFLNLPNVVGASGAVFGILLAFGMLFPNTRIYLYFAIPIKAKWFVILYGALELYLGISNQEHSNVAHFAHLGGMVFGFILIKYWYRKR